MFLLIKQNLLDRLKPNFRFSVFSGWSFILSEQKSEQGPLTLVKISEYQTNSIQTI